ncbi:peptidoglycan-binding domain-containing protein [Bifidobacterium animalis]|nr:peptidoglycan-binding protein [Bifidobacterium animalis]MCR1995247.1 peptidoglycan-binding protein [Bifidobacterium animalis subsp. animalis]HJD88177.1 peptidoglycan-binding protein [Bifidobacterium animalis]
MHKRRSWLRPFGMAMLAMLLVAMLAVGIVATTVGIQASREEPEPPVTLTTTMRTRTLADEITGALVAFPDATIGVTAEGTVTRNGISVGTALNEGGVIGVVNERPILLMQGVVPMWRALAPGMHGEDVLQMQNALVRLGYAIYDESGTYGDSTALAMNQYLAALGYEAVNASNVPLKADDWKQTAVPQQQLVFAPSVPAQAETTCGVAGQTIAGSLCTLETASCKYAAAFAAVDVPDVAALEGAPAAILISDGAVNGVVGKQYEVERSAGDEKSDNASSVQSDDSAGSLIYLRLENLDGGKLQKEAAAIGSGNVRVAVTRTQGETDALTIESTALRQDGSTTWVLVDGGRRVDVETGLCVQGICEISGDNLAAGTVVVLPTPDDGDEGKGAGDE